MEIPCIIQRMCGKSVLPVSSSRAKPRDLFRWRQDGECLTARNGKHRFSEKEEGGAPLKSLAKEGGKRGRKRFLAALEMTAWGTEIPSIAQRMCEKSVLPVSSSRAKPRDLFRWRQDGECLTARNGKHRFSEKEEGGAPLKSLAKEGKRGTKKISRYARNDSVGNGNLVHHTKNVWEKRSSRIVIPSEVEGSFSLAMDQKK